MRQSPAKPVETRILRVVSIVHAGLLGLLAAAVTSAVGCAPTVDNSGCSMDVDCTGRAEVCDVANSVCIPKTVDTTTTESPAPANFTGKAVPFHRGEVCMVHDVKSGSKVPITINPCFHPCLDKGMHQFKHYYECIGSRCEAWAVMYIDAASVAEGCPADAFGAFDEALCSYGPAVNISIATTIDSGPVNGTMGFELPFLTNADAQAILGTGNSTDVIQEKIEQYPESDDRVPGGKDIVLSPNSPEPPADCEAEGACPCYRIGF